MSGKQTGLGHGFWLGGNDLSGDVTQLGRIGGGPAALECTGIDKYGYERTGGLFDGEVSLITWWSPTTNHPVLSALPTADIVEAYVCVPGLGNPIANLVAKQPNYDGDRAADGSFTFGVQGLGNGYGIEWGTQLSAGKITHTTGTTVASVDGGATAATDFGCAAYLHVFALTGTNVVVTLEHSSDDLAWDTLLTFTSATAVTAERVAVAAGTGAIERYVRIVTTGTFTSATFAVALCRYPVAISL